MNAVYSFWSKPFDKFGGGFNSSRHLLSSLAFSVIHATGFDQKVLYTDRPELLAPCLPLFDRVEVIDFPDVDEKHWAVSKIYVYSLQNQPFLHIDNDVFFLKGTPAKVFSAQAIAQSVETKEDFWHNYFPQYNLVAKYGKFPKHWVFDWPFSDNIFSYNAGVLGGINLDFIHEYADTALEYMSHFPNEGDINTTIEQSYFSMTAKALNIKVDTIIDDWKNTAQARRIGFRHFWGGTKKGLNPKNGRLYMDEVEEELFRENPTIFNSIKKHFYGISRSSV